MGSNWQATWKMGKYISIIFLSQGKVADCLYTSQSENDTIIPELMRGVITPPPKSKLGAWIRSFLCHFSHWHLHCLLINKSPHCICSSRKACSEGRPATCLCIYNLPRFCKLSSSHSVPSMINVVIWNCQTLSFCHVFQEHSLFIRSIHHCSSFIFNFVPCVFFL